MICPQLDLRMISPNAMLFKVYRPSIHPLQGSLTHEKLPPPYDHRRAPGNRPTVESYEEDVSNERSTPLENPRDVLCRRVCEMEIQSSQTPNTLFEGGGGGRGIWP